MKLLLTSGGITNPSLQAALVDLLGKPIAECAALCIPTGTYAHPACDPTVAWRFVTGRSTPMTGLGWKSVGLLELTALPSIGAARWVPWVEAADVLLVDGGDVHYLAYWLRRSGLADLLPSLPDKVWVGLSAGSMVLTPRAGDPFTQWRAPEGGDETLGLVDFSIFPHLDYPGFTANTMAHAERWAAGIGHPSYALDDQSGIVVEGGRVEVVSEGKWRRFPG